MMTREQFLDVLTEISVRWGASRTTWVIQDQAEPAQAEIRWQEWRRKGVEADYRRVINLLVDRSPGRLPKPGEFLEALNEVRQRNAGDAAADDQMTREHCRENGHTYSSPGTKNAIEWEASHIDPKGQVMVVCARCGHEETWSTARALSYFWGIGAPVDPTQGDLETQAEVYG